MGTGLTFADIPAGRTIFIDANPLIDHFSANPLTGAACTELVRRISQGEIAAVCCVHVLGEVTHRLLTIEACEEFGWPYKGIAQRLAGHPDEIQRLSKYQQAIAAVPLLGIQVLPVVAHQVGSAARLMQQHGLLFNDALVVAIIEDHNLSHLASHDADFDRVPGLTRYAPM